MDFLWNILWSVIRYIMGPLSGWWGLCGTDQQCLAAPIWKYRSGFGDHRFTFFIDLLPNYTFYTNLTNIVHWVVAYRDVAHLITLNLGKSWEKYAKSFDAGLILWLKNSTFTLHLLSTKYFKNSCIARSSAIILLNIWDKEVIVFLEEIFQLSAACHCWEIVENQI